MKNIFLWLDDIRTMPNSYNLWVKTAQEAIEILSTNNVQAISLDHDLGIGDGTGYDVAKWIEENASWLTPIQCSIHTQNPVGRKNMCFALQNAYKIWDE